jgi:hypothetical protein
MRDKNIVGFYGNTGSGNSTSINYFLRVPLRKHLNRYGDNIIESKCSNQNAKNAEECKIGQSKGISETQYSQGFSIPEEKLTLNDQPCL